MKTHDHLWPQIAKFENLYLAWLETRRGKSTKRQAVQFEAQLEQNLLALVASFPRFRMGTHGLDASRLLYFHT